VSPVKFDLGFCIPEDDILHSHLRENLKLYNTVVVKYIHISMLGVIRLLCPLVSEVSLVNFVYDLCYMTTSPGDVCLQCISIGTLLKYSRFFSSA
jgi:hypothetical protein